MNMKSDVVEATESFVGINNVHTISIAVHRETCINKNRNKLSLYIQIRCFSVHISADRVFASLDYAEHDAVPKVAEATVFQDRSPDKTRAGDLVMIALSKNVFLSLLYTFAGPLLGPLRPIHNDTRASDLILRFFLRKLLNCYLILVVNTSVNLWVFVILSSKYFLVCTILLNYLLIIRTISQ